MWLLIVGLVLFLGVHSSRIFADGFRTRFIAERGENAWKGVYSVVSIAGFLMIVYGYGRARLEPVVLWVSPVWLTHLNVLLMLVAFVLLGAYLVPGNRLRAALGHPMVLAVKVWAFAHLLVNGTLADLLLFGSFLIWAIVDYVASRRRDRRESVVRIGKGGLVADLATIGTGVLLWGLFALWLHAALIGVSPFAGMTS